MDGFKPQGPEQHFALQRTTRAAETVTDVTDAQRKSSEETRNTNERFYNNLALFSSGTIALSITFMGYLKSQPKPLAHPYWLVALLGLPHRLRCVLLVLVIRLRTLHPLLSRVANRGCHPKEAGNRSQGISHIGAGDAQFKNQSACFPQ